MITFEELINSEFEQAKPKEIISLIAKHNLLEPIKKSISAVNAHLGNYEHEKESYGVPQLAHIASTLLIKINEHLRTLKKARKQDDKKKLEYLLGHILRQLLVQITLRLPDEAKIKFSTTTYTALKDTCIICDYDFEELMKFLSIQNKANENSANYFSNSAVVIAEASYKEIPSYTWKNGSKEQFDAFIEMVRRNNITRDISKLKKLFQNPSKNLAIKFDEKRPVFVVQFLSCVNDSGYIAYNGCGFYQVLECHVFNFKTTFLKNNTAQRQVAAVKKPEAWKAIKTRLEGELKEIHKLGSDKKPNQVSSLVSSVVMQRST